MDNFTLTMFLGSGLAWGMIHAFDPDHVAAVAGVSAGSNQPQHKLWHFALRWSLGHGMAIATIALAVCVFGMAIPEKFSHLAESSVSLLLILLGSLALYRLLVNENRKIFSHLPQRGAVFVGIVHGVAGSAPLLALIPLASVSHPLIAMLYVLLFSAGVLLAMTALGRLMMYSLQYCSQVTAHYRNAAQIMFALLSIGVGISLLL